MGDDAVCCKQLAIGNAPRCLYMHFLGRAMRHGAQCHRDNGEWPVAVSSVPKSASPATTFERDVHPCRDPLWLLEIFTRRCARLAQCLQHQGYAGRTIPNHGRHDRNPYCDECPKYVAMKRRPCLPDLCVSEPESSKDLYVMPSSSLICSRHFRYEHIVFADGQSGNKL